MPAAIQGELTFATMPRQLAALAGLSGPRIDLGGCPRLDSAGAAFLLEYARRQLAPGQKLEVVNASAQALSLLRFFELDEVFAIA